MRPADAYHTADVKGRVHKFSSRVNENRLDERNSNSQDLQELPNDEKVAQPFFVSMTLGELPL